MDNFISVEAKEGHRNFVFQNAEHPKAKDVMQLKNLNENGNKGYLYPESERNS